jgi:O-antigen/teichoic acid export membrane protein
MAFTVFVNLYSTRLVLNALGVADFGIFGVIGSVLGMLGFLMAALASTTTRFVNYYEGKGEIEKLKIVFNNSILLHVALASFLVVILELALPFLFDGILNIPVNRVYAAKMIYHFMVVSTFFSVITVPYDATINAHENMLYYAVTGLLESVAKLGIAFYLLYTLSDKLIIYGFLTAILSIFLLFIKQIYCRIKYKECRLDI